jgi:hypothetical protein
MRTRICLSALLAVLCVPLFGTPAGAVEVGIVETLGQTKPTAETASGLGARWVRLWATWEGAQPSGPGSWDVEAIRAANFAVSQAKARGLKVLMVVQRSPRWASGGHGGIHPPTDPATFGAAMGGFARQVPGVDAWELWNEEDAHMFWAGGADPAKYAAMVKAAYPAIKAAQPHDVVVTGATTGNNMDFIEALYAQGIKGSFDAVGVHTDTACLVDGPGRYYRDERGRIGQYTFSAFREVHAVMRRHGDGAKPIWMTELGWGTETSAPGSCNVGKWAGQKPLGVTEAQQAEFLRQAYSCLAADPIVTVAFWFGIQDIPGSPYPGGYGLYRHDGSAKPAAAAFRGLANGIPPVPCGGVVDVSGPQIEIAQPLDGLRFVDMIDIDAQGVDAPGGVGIARIKMYADGKFERTFGDGHARISPWWPSRYWKRGKHTITFKAIDEANNVITKSVTVHKVKRLPKVATSATLSLEHLDATTVKVTGAVSSRTAHAATSLRGRAFVVFQKRVGGKRKWKTVHRIGRRADKPVGVTKRVKPGAWRVYLRYPGRTGFKKSRSKALRFRIA